MQESKISTSDAKKSTSPCDVDALKKCLEENKGNYVKCQAHMEAFKSSCSIKRPQNHEAGFNQLKDLSSFFYVNLLVMIDVRFS